MANGQTAEPGVSQYQGLNNDQSIVGNNAFPIENGVHNLTNTAIYQSETLINQDQNSSLPQPAKIQQPVAMEVPKENVNFLDSIKMKKRKRDCSPFNIVFTNGQDVQNDQRNSPPLSPSSSSMVTILKFQNGDFVEVPSSLPTYNSPMSLRDMRKAIINSLESCLMEPVAEPKPTQAWTVQSPPRQTSPKAVPEPIKDTKEPINSDTKKIEKDTVIINPPLPPPVQAPESPKVKKQTVTKPVKVKKPKSPDKESIKFANRQKELMKLKREMRKRMKMEGQDSELAKAALGVWGRTVGVLCTMCGKHVQKSYGCFRRDNSPEKLMYLFTPGMNRIKICRRCLPYKKQTPNGEEPKKGKSTSRKPTNVVKQVATSTVMKEENPQEKPASSITIDAIQRKLTTPTPSPLYQPSQKMILGESGKAEAIEYIKMLAGNVSSSNDQCSPSVTNNTQISHGVPLMTPLSPLTPVTPSNAMNPNILKSTDVHQVVSVPISQRFQPNITPQSQPNIILRNTQPGIANQDAASSMLSTPPWTPIPLTIKQVTPLPMSPAVPPATVSTIAPTNTVQSLTLSSGESQIIPTAIVVSSQNKTPTQAPVLFQLQRIKLLTPEPAENQEMEANQKVAHNNLGGKDKRASSASQSPVACACCNSSVMKSYRYVTKTQSPPKLQYLFNSDSKALVICCTCLNKDRDATQLTTIGEEKEDPEHSGLRTCVDGEINEESGGNEKPGESYDKEVTCCAQEINLEGNEVKSGDKEVLLKDGNMIHNDYVESNEDHGKVIGDLDGTLGSNITDSISTGINTGRSGELNNTNGASENGILARSFEDTQDSCGLKTTISNDRNGIPRAYTKQQVHHSQVELSSNNQGFLVSPKGGVLTGSTATERANLLVTPEIVVENSEITLGCEELNSKKSFPVNEAVVAVKNKEVRDIQITENDDATKIATTNASGDHTDIIILRSKKRNVESNDNSEPTNTSEGLSHTYVAIEKETSSLPKESHSPEKLSASKENLSQKKELCTTRENSCVDEPSSPTGDKPTEKLNVLKENDKKSRQTKPSPKRSPGKNTIGARCPQTRGATLKNMKEIESLKEIKETPETTSQGVKRKRQYRGKKSKTEDENEELKPKKQELAKEISRSPSKRAKTKKE